VRDGGWGALSQIMLPKTNALYKAFLFVQKPFVANSMIFWKELPNFEKKSFRTVRFLYMVQVGEFFFKSLKIFYIYMKISSFSFHLLLMVILA
jgi:hypothetical protein